MGFVSAKFRHAILRSLPYLASLVVTSAFTVFFNGSLDRYAEQFAADFKARNLIEINSGAIYPISSNLNSVSGLPNILCARGWNVDDEFFRYKPTSCTEWNPLVRTVTLSSDSGTLRIEFAVRLPAETENLFLGFFGFILLLVGIVYWTSRTLESLQHEQRVAWVQAEVERLKEDLVEKTRNSALGDLAAQVAHDIRSPLAALDVILSRLQELPEDERLVIRGAVNRIRDIANNLIQTNRTAQKIESRGEPVSLLLSSLIDPLITEKRTLFRSRIGIVIEGVLDQNSYGLFARIEPIEFKRVLSNLINNAVEAIEADGRVEVRLHLDSQENALLTINDNGRGIPARLLPKLGARGESHGKEGGSGLGLHHARTTIESWGGTLTLLSQEGKGTTVTLTLPRSEPPTWFVSHLELEPDSPILILDDDTSIHSIWQGRFESLRVAERGIEVLHFSTPPSLASWIEENRARIPSATLLVDYELLGQAETGLAVIERLGVASRAILVTSRFEERKILQECQRLSVRLIPKSLAGFVPVHFRDRKEDCDAILIDDDELIHLTWRYAAKAAGKRHKAYASPAEFFKEMSRYRLDCPVYVDVNLGRGIRGDEIARQISNQGFTQVYLATGENPAQYADLRFLAGVRSKDPPWKRT